MARLAWLLAVALLFPGLAEAAVTQTAEYQADATHSGDVYGAGVVPPLTQAWTATTGLQNTYPVIDGGRVFALAEPGGGSGAVQVEALDLTSGQVDWAQPLPAGSNKYVVADGGRVYAVSQVSQAGTAQTELWAFDERSGAEDWAEILPGGQYLPSPPVAAAGTVYVSSAGTGDDVFAVRETDGSVLWHMTGTEGSGLALAGSTLVLAGVCGNSFGFDASTGAVRWHDDPGCNGGGTVMPSFDGSHAWATALDGGYTGNGGTSAGEVYDPASGAVAQSFLGFAPAFAYGEAVLTRTTQDGAAQYGLAAVDPGSLAVRWSFGGPNTAPLLADGEVFAASYSASDVVALDPCSGLQTWSAPLPAPVMTDRDVQTGLAAGGGYLVVPTESGLVAFDSGRQPPANGLNCLAAGSGTAAAPGQASATGAPSSSSFGGSGEGLTPANPSSGDAVLRLRSATCSRVRRQWRCVLIVRARGGTVVRATISRGRLRVAGGLARVRHGQARVVLRVRIPARSRLRVALTLTRGTHKIKSARASLNVP